MAKREIKFRAWNKKKKLFSRGIEVDCFGSIQEYKFSGSAYYGVYNVNESGGCEADNIFELNQYTGLKDENSGEIYEGDIVEDNDKKTYKVIWHIQQGCWWLSPIHDLEDYILRVMDNQKLGNGYYSRKDLKIIGNIYENKDLIND